MRAHPRSRGEHLCNSFTGASRSGSSPLARGTQRGGLLEWLRFGLIPARAGNTIGYVRCVLSGRAHPRSRGEHVMPKVRRPVTLGSSPLARGTLMAHGEGSGFTVAHPRSRGEHTDIAGMAEGTPGSSPLARGTPHVGVGLPIAGGLIPARAGNTVCATDFESDLRAHPRSRGEHVRVQPVISMARGSSPLARGTPTRGIWCCPCRGLIPARAGNTDVD